MDSRSEYIDPLTGECRPMCSDPGDQNLTLPVVLCISEAHPDGCLSPG
jgi:hypothetical protein